MTASFLLQNNHKGSYCFLQVQIKKRCSKGKDLTVYRQESWIQPRVGLLLMPLLFLSFSNLIYYFYKNVTAVGVQSYIDY